MREEKWREKTKFRDRHHIIIQYSRLHVPRAHNLSCALACALACTSNYISTISCTMYIYYTCVIIHYYSNVHVESRSQAFPVTGKEKSKVQFQIFLVSYGESLGLRLCQTGFSDSEPSFYPVPPPCSLHIPSLCSRPRC